jgi:hypothetical protein
LASPAVANLVAAAPAGAQQGVVNTLAAKPPADRANLVALADSRPAVVTAFTQLPQATQTAALQVLAAHPAAIPAVAGFRAQNVAPVLAALAQVPPAKQANAVQRIAGLNDAWATRTVALKMNERVAALID